MVLRSLRMGEHDWTAEIVLRGAPDDASAQPTPPPGGFELGRTTALRQQIAQLRSQIAEYDRILGDPAGRHIAACAGAEADRLQTAQRAWDAGWSGPGAPLASGSMRFENGAARLDGPLAPGVDAAALATIASSRHLDIASVDASSASLIAKEP